MSIEIKTQKIENETVDVRIGHDISNGLELRKSIFERLSAVVI